MTTETNYEIAKAHVIKTRIASVSGIQRKLRIGYNQAARIMEELEKQNVVSEPGHNGNREVLAPPIPEDVKLANLKSEALDALQVAQTKMYEYAKECEVGIEREKAFQVHENIRLATRV